MKTKSYIFSLIISFLFLSLFSVSAIAEPAIDNQYIFESKERINRFEADYTYRIKIINDESSITNVTATATSNANTTKIIDGDVSFNDIPANTTSQSLDTIKIRQDRRVKFNPSSITWSIKNDGGGDNGIPKFVVKIDTNPSIALLNSNVALEAKIVKNSHSISKVSWEFEDGRKFEGSSISVPATKDGVLYADVTVTSSNGDIETTNISVPVITEPTKPPSVLKLPKLPGDINLDNRITLSDAYAISKHVSGLEIVDDTLEKSIDVSFDNKADQDDVQLINLAIIENTTTPTLSLPNEGVPGTAVTLFNPELFDLTRTFIVKIGNSITIQEPQRIIPGVANVIIPLDPITPNSIAVNNEQEINIELIEKSTNQVVESYSFKLLPPKKISDPIAETLQLLSGINTSINSANDEFKNLLNDQNLTGEQREILNGFNKVAADEIKILSAEVNSLLNQPGAENLAKMFMQFINANEDISFLNNVSANNSSQKNIQILAAQVSPDFVCDVAIPTICDLQAAVEVLKKIGSAVSLACDILFFAAVGAIIIPADGPFLDVALVVAWASKCATIDAILEVASILYDIVGVPKIAMALKTSTPTPDINNPALLTASVSISYGSICGKLAGKGIDLLLKKIGERAVGQLIRKKFKISRNTLIKIFTIGGESLLSPVLTRLSNSIGKTIKATPLDEAIEQFAFNLCNQIGPPGTPVTINASKVLKTPSIGSLSFNNDGTANYICPSDSSSSNNSVKIIAEKKICEKTEQRELDISCGGKEVTITIGDNGAANDDIFEVRIDGKSVLTSNSPVRTISAKVFLPIGDTEVQMIGRAAPDGIGTYFISFSGATLIGGAAPSGRDLTPGKIKTFTIRVN